MIELVNLCWIFFSSTVQTSNARTNKPGNAIANSGFRFSEYSATPPFVKQQQVQLSTFSPKLNYLIATYLKFVIILLLFP